MKWLLSSSSCQITWFNGIFTYTTYEGFSDPQPGQWTVKISHRKGAWKIMNIGSKASPQKGGDGGSQKTPLSLAGNTWGEKIPKCLLLRVIKHEKPWKLRSMFTPPKKKCAKSLCFERDTSTNACFWNVMLVFGRVLFWVKSNALWTLHPTANEKQQNWHLCYILILPLKNNMSPEKSMAGRCNFLLKSSLFKGHGNFSGSNFRTSCWGFQSGITGYVVLLFVLNVRSMEFPGSLSRT